MISYFIIFHPVLILVQIKSDFIIFHLILILVQVISDFIIFHLVLVQVTKFFCHLILILVQVVSYFIIFRSVLMVQTLAKYMVLGRHPTKNFIQATEYLMMSYSVVGFA